MLYICIYFIIVLDIFMKKKKKNAVSFQFWKKIFLPLGPEKKIFLLRGEEKKIFLLGSKPPPSPLKV